MNVIEAKNICKSYGKGESRVDVLKNIDLEIKKGEFVVILGKSGSGKSTLLHIVGGIDKATRGSISINGKELTKMNEAELSILRRRNIGFIFQSFNLIPVLSVEENIEMPVLLDKGVMDSKYKEELIKLLQLEDRKNHLPSQLSGGQQQRVSIGRALANKPSIILADEPTGNLDSITSKDIMELLRFSAKKYNQTLILITHDLNIARMADRIITIKDGVISNDEVISGG
ncbi:ABC transporter ATP-binding protein [Romboutsia weinsteinii]|uniref:ABC transporter ATP-binding protein n=1 Tax=Romboutsia weinsteinii TaxID=2020949 RepID=A0A371J047_9FIRM|nr:ABC transporter ATP-binding protein [Romboutsia weinsteinii]RDY26139.1 ABC transporter ATP-binding protein [Romboutsia weinsteinii]